MAAKKKRKKIKTVIVPIDAEQAPPIIEVDGQRVVIVQPTHWPFDSDEAVKPPPPGSLEELRVLYDRAAQEGMSNPMRDFVDALLTKLEGIARVFNDHEHDLLTRSWDGDRPFRRTQSVERTIT